MAIVLRLSRGGAKKRPFYRIVVADSRRARDGRYIEKLGTYNPMLPKDSDERVMITDERVRYWLGQGAKPSDRVATLLAAKGIGEAPKRNNPNKAKPGKKAMERIEEQKAKAEAKKAAEEEAKAEAEAAAAAESEAPAEEAPAEEAAPAEDASPAEEAAADEVPAEEAAAEEAPAEEASAEDAEEKKADA